LSFKNALVNHSNVIRRLLLQVSKAEPKWVDSNQQMQINNAVGLQRAGIAHWFSLHGKLQQSSF
jgi:hypothetical protein